MTGRCRVCPWSTPTTRPGSASTLLARALLQARAAYPQAPVLMHPECPAELRRQADYLGGTMGIVRYAAQSAAQEFIIATEQGVLYPLQQQCPGKKFHLASRRMLCVNMKKTTLEKVSRALETMEPRVVVPEDIRRRAAAALQKMLEIKGR